MKRLLLIPFLVAARLWLPFAKLPRLWAFASLQAHLRTRVPASTTILGTPEVHGTGQIELGTNLYLYPGLYLETRDRGAITIGDSAVLSRGVHLVAYAGIEIGSGAMIGEYASVRDANHDYRGPGPLRNAGHHASRVRIGCNAWIGRGATVLPGVIIGDHAVVGANAVVTRDVPAYAVVGGVPARPLSSRRAA